MFPPPSPVGIVSSPRSSGNLRAPKGRCLSGVFFWGVGKVLCFFGGVWLFWCFFGMVFGRVFVKLL